MQALVYGSTWWATSPRPTTTSPFSDQLNSSAFLPVVQTFTYDNLYRLRPAAGRYQERSDWHYEYTLAMAYNTMANTAKPAELALCPRPELPGQDGGRPADH